MEKTYWLEYGGVTVRNSGHPATWVSILLPQGGQDQVRFPCSMFPSCVFPTVILITYWHYLFEVHLLC